MADKVKRAERLSVMGKILTSSPNKIFTLSYFCEMFGAAKSTVSEDTAILARTWRTFRLGTVETVTGAAGGVRYRPAGNVQAAISTCPTYWRSLKPSAASGS